MGEVYRAYDTTLRRPLAIKVLREGRGGPDDQLLREAQSASALNHAAICTVYEIGAEQGSAFIAMEYVDGESLAAKIARGPLEVGDVVRWGMDVADALSHAHERGVIHRDLKAANVIVSTSGRPKIVDFGLARRLDAQMAAASTVGTAPRGTERGHALRHGPRTGQGDDRRSTHRHLGARHPAVRDGFGPSAVHRPQPGGADGVDPARSACPSPPDAGGGADSHGDRDLPGKGSCQSLSARREHQVRAPGFRLARFGSRRGNARTGRAHAAAATADARTDTEGERVCRPRTRAWPAHRRLEARQRGPASTVSGGRRTGNRQDAPVGRVRAPLRRRAGHGAGWSLRRRGTGALPALRRGARMVRPGLPRSVAAIGDPRPAAASWGRLRQSSSSACPTCPHRRR